MLLVDTNILIDYIREVPACLQFVGKYHKNDLTISQLVVFELYQGARNKTELLKIKQQLNGFLLLPIDEATSTLALSIYEKYVLSYGLDIPDAFIAATALLYNLELRTYNLKDFRMIDQIKCSNSLA